MEEFDSELKRASLSLQSDTKRLLIKSEFNFFNRGNLGMLFIGLFSLIATILIVLNIKEIGVMIFCLIITSFILVFSILGISKQVMDFVEISDRRIRFSNSLQKKEFLISPDFKIKVESEITKVKGKYRPASYFCTVELYLKTSTEKYRILDYQVDKKYSKKAKKIGKELKKMMIERF